MSRQTIADLRQQIAVLERVITELRIDSPDQLALYWEAIKQRWISVASNQGHVVLRLTKLGALQIETNRNNLTLGKSR